MSSVPADLQSLEIQPLDSQHTDALNELAVRLSVQQLQWASGYLAGLAAAGTAANLEPTPLAARPVAAADSGERLTILYGSQTGNGERIAEELANAASAAGLPNRVLSLADYKPAELKRESYVSFVVSTHGEGDPPDDAELFYDYLLSERAPELPNLRYTVLALGDSSYVNFCQTGREFDQRLEQLGAERIRGIQECDLDYDDDAAAWSADVLAGLADELTSSVQTNVAELRPVAASNVAHYDKRNPFAAEVLVNQKITAGTSSKDVRHIELSVDGSGLVYEPGDSLAVIADNPPQLVEQLIATLNLQPTAVVRLGDRDATLAEALSSELEITAVNARFLAGWAERSAATELAALLQADAKEALSQYIDNHQIIDVVRQFPAVVDAQAMVDLLRKLSPRSYSIASSIRANPDEVHLTVAALRYEAFGSDHWGAASTHLADRLDVGDRVRVFVEPNKRFRLPADDVPIVMIGPGTGVAPFRAFVEERAERDASGENWLFFGDRNFSEDFLYQLEWQRYLKSGSLTRLDAAFSRDQSQKIYVQDRIRERAADLYDWLQRGACVYVCGDAKRMAGDVHDALRDVIAEQAGVSSDDAEQRLSELRRSGRYLRDVY